LSKKRKVINQVSILKAKWIAGLDFFSLLEHAHFFSKENQCFIVYLKSKNVSFSFKNTDFLASEK